jgi:hypothetical protein
MLGSAATPAEGESITVFGPRCLEPEAGRGMSRACQGTRSNPHTWESCVPVSCGYIDVHKLDAMVYWEAASPVPSPGVAPVLCSGISRAYQSRRGGGDDGSPTGLRRPRRVARGVGMSAPPRSSDEGRLSLMLRRPCGWLACCYVRVCFHFVLKANAPVAEPIITAGAYYDDAEPLRAIRIQARSSRRPIDTSSLFDLDSS